MLIINSLEDDNNQNQPIIFNSIFEPLKWYFYI
jgi:hypothetical protein